MRSKVAAHMGTQRGLVLRRQVLAAGGTEKQIHDLVTRGEWVVVRRGVYTTRALWDSLDEFQGRPRLRAWAASLNMDQPHVLSHESAALAHEMQILRPNPWLVHVTRFGVMGCRKRHGVCHHQAPFTSDQIVEVQGVPTFDMARTAVDIARSHGQRDGLRYGLVACDSAMRAGTTKEQLEEAVAPMANWPNVTIAREAVDLAIPDSDSAAESLGRLVLITLGYDDIEAQFGLTDGGRRVWVDLRVGRHLVEVDGKVKYRSVADGGVSDQDPHEALWEEKLRQDWLTDFRLGMTRLVWDDLMPRQWRDTQDRVARDIAATRARYGDDITDLSPYRINEPRRRTA